MLVDLLLTHAESSRGALIDAHARSHVGETALHLAAASGHFDICKMLLSRTNLQLRGPAAESLHTITPLQLAGTTAHWQLALQLAAYVPAWRISNRPSPVGHLPTHGPSRLAPP